jgi:hypothetical protein
MHYTNNYSKLYYNCSIAQDTLGGYLLLNYIARPKATITKATITKATITTVLVTSKDTINNKKDKLPVLLRGLFAPLLIGTYLDINLRTLRSNYTSALELEICVRFPKPKYIF